MLKAGGPAAMRHALSASRQGPFRATHRGLQVVCGSGQAGDSGLPGLAPDQQRRALTVPSGAQHINWREFGDSLGGSLIVDNASHKEEVHKVGGPGALAACSVHCSISLSAAAASRSPAHHGHPCAYHCHTCSSSAAAGSGCRR
jgi:hypothetical protein